jgi:hypothetical protein
LTSAFPSNFPNQEDPLTSTHSFIVKIWLEEISEDGKPVWRGHITHVPSNRKEYFVILEDIPTLISSYLQIDNPPVEAPKRSGLFRDWFKDLKPRFSQKIGRNAPKK